MNTAKGKIFKKVLIFVLMLSFVFGQLTPVQAAAKRTRYTIALNKPVYTLNKGKSVKLKAALNKAAKKKGVEWKSSDPKIAAVSKIGKVTAKKNGKAIITARVRGTKVNAKSRITVGTPVRKVILNRKSVSLKTGQKFTLRATISPKKASDKKVAYESSNSRAAAVNQKGVIRAISAGTAKITVTAADGSGKKATCTVKVSRRTENTGSTVPVAGKILVAYFSWSGTSERIANDIIRQTGADPFRIERETPYSDDYSEVAYGEARDEADNNARPPIKDPPASVAQYDRIILCYPIWWHTAPMTVGTFLERYDLTGKHIYPVSQSASMDISQYAQSVGFIRACAPGAVVDDGIFSKDDSVIRSYIANTVL